MTKRKPFQVIPTGKNTFCTLLYIHCRKTSFACFLIERGEIMTRLLHHIYDLVEGNAVDAILERGKDITVESTGGCKRIALKE